MVIFFVFPTVTDLQISACFSFFGLPVFLAMRCTHSTWDLSSPTRDGSHAPVQEKHGVLPTGPSEPSQTLLTLQQRPPTSGMRIWGGADVIIIEIEYTVNVMLESSANHPPAGPWKNCLPQNWSLVPKRSGTLLYCMILLSSHLKAISTCVL